MVVLYHNKNASDAKIDKSYKRLIFDSHYDTSTNKFTFKIVKTPPDVEEVFEAYPEVQESYLEFQKTTSRDAYVYLLDYLSDQQNSESDFVTTYTAGEPLDSEDYPRKHCYSISWTTLF